MSLALDLSISIFFFSAAEPAWAHLNLYLLLQLEFEAVSLDYCWNFWKSTDLEDFFNLHRMMPAVFFLASCLYAMIIYPPCAYIKMDDVEHSTREAKTSWSLSVGGLQYKPPPWKTQSKPQIHFPSSWCILNCLFSDFCYGNAVEHRDWLLSSKSRNH